MCWQQCKEGQPLQSDCLLGSNERYYAVGISPSSSLANLRGHAPPLPTPQTLGPFCAALSAAEVFSSLVRPPPVHTYAPMGRRQAGRSSGGGSEGGAAEPAGAGPAAALAAGEAAPEEDGCLVVEEDRQPAREKAQAMVASGRLAGRGRQEEVGMAACLGGLVPSCKAQIQVMWEPR